MSQLVSVSQQADRIKTIFKANSDRMVRMVPRTQGDPSRLLSIAFSTIAYDSTLVQCTPESLFGGVLECLKLGLTLGGPMQEAWLIPFKNHGRLEATLIVGYQGYRNIIDRSKAVMDLHPRAVYSNDMFDVEFGTHPRVTHKPYWMLGHPEKGDLIAVYAVAHLRGGGVQIEVMPKSEVDEHRAKSRAKDSGPWVTFYEAMALKTVIRKIAKYLPKSNEMLARALDLDDRADRGVSQEFDVAGLTLDLADGPQPAKQIGSSGVERLKEKLKADQADVVAAPKVATQMAGQIGDRVVAELTRDYHATPATPVDDFLGDAMDPKPAEAKPTKKARDANADLDREIAEAEGLFDQK